MQKGKANFCHICCWKQFLSWICVNHKLHNGFLKFRICFLFLINWLVGIKKCNWEILILVRKGLIGSVVKIFNFVNKWNYLSMQQVIKGDSLYIVTILFAIIFSFAICYGIIRSLTGVIDAYIYICQKNITA